jgi:hypothetical protein
VTLRAFYHRLNSEALPSAPYPVSLRPHQSPSLSCVRDDPPPPVLATRHSPNLSIYCGQKEDAVATYISLTESLVRVLTLNARRSPLGWSSWSRTACFTWTLLLATVLLARVTCARYIPLFKPFQLPFCFSLHSVPTLPARNGVSLGHMTIQAADLWFRAKSGTMPQPTSPPPSQPPPPFQRPDRQPPLRSHLRTRAPTLTLERS